MCGFVRNCRVFLWTCSGPVALLLGLCGSACMLAWADGVEPRASVAGEPSLEEIPSAIATAVAQNAEVIRGMPRHPRSSDVLGAIADIYVAEVELDQPDAYVQIARDFPDSNLGLYALSTWLETGERLEDSTVVLWSIIRTQPDTRLARYALGRVLEVADDTRAVCITVISEFGKATVGTYAREKLAKQFIASGDYLEGLELYLNAYLNAVESRPDRLDGLRMQLSSAFVQASLPYCAAAVDAMSDDQLNVQHLEALRLRRVIGEMSGQTSCEGRSAEANYYPALWNARLNPDKLAALAHECPDDIVAARARLLLGVLRLDAGDGKAFASIMHEFVGRWEGLDADFSEKANLLLDSFCFACAKDSWSLSDSYKDVHCCVREFRPALRHLLALLRASPGRDSATTALLLRLADAFHVGRWPWGELDVIRYLCAEFPHTGDTPALHLRAARVYGGDFHNYGQAARECRLARNMQEGGPHSLDAVFLEARNLYMAEEFEAALKCLREIDKNADAALVQDSLYLQALALFRGGDVPAAIRALNHLEREYPESDSSDLVVFLRGYLYLLERNDNAAQDAFRQFLARFPHSRLSSKAERIAGQIETLGKRAIRSPGESKALSNRPNVVLISLDTVRADHLSCYGYERRTTPNIDAIAREGVIFTNCTSTSSCTLPSHASVFTSLYPSVHGAERYSPILSLAAKTMGECLRELGYATIGVISAPWLNAHFGFDPGFDIYDDYTFDLDRDLDLFQRCFPELDRSDAALTEYVYEGFTEYVYEGFEGSIITAAASAHLERAEADNRPFFLFINYYDPHHNYTPPWPYSTRFDDEGQGIGAGRIEAWVKKVQETEDWVNGTMDFEKTGTGEITQIMALYDGEIAYVDEQVGRLVERLKREGEYANTVFLIFGDHGEEFLEHGGLMHWRSLYREVVHVPLIMAGPGIPRGIRDDQPVSLVDVLPTLLRLVGGEIPEAAQGRDLLQEAAASSAMSAPVFCDVVLPFTGEPPRRLQAVIRDSWKVILNVEDDSAELYNLHVDPGEKLNVADEHPDLVENLKNELAAFNSENEQLRSALKSGAGTLPAPSTEELERIRTRLRALGYAGK